MIRPAAALAALIVAAAAAGCGGTGAAAPGQADLANGKKLFTTDCGTCHTLEDAGTKGTVGPNLDWADLGNRLENMDPTSFEAFVREQIESPDPRGKMPPNIVKGTDAQDVAAYVASVAGLKLAAQQKRQNDITTSPE
ncbi:MAG: c-type cytochrome [Gaiellales bacterium]